MAERTRVDVARLRRLLDDDRYSREFVGSVALRMLPDLLDAVEERDRLMARVRAVKGLTLAWKVAVENDVVSEGLDPETLGHAARWVEDRLDGDG